MSGAPALADMEPELAARPSRLTVTIGFGPVVLPSGSGCEDQRPPGLVEIPPLPIDRLQDRWSGGDLMLQVGADDQVTLAHATRLLLRDGRAFAQVRWVQRGFREARGATPEGTTGRNLFGQVDGTVNPEPGTDDFANVVWASDGAGVVQRRHDDGRAPDQVRPRRVGRSRSRRPRAGDRTPTVRRRSAHGRNEDSTPDLQAGGRAGDEADP